MEENFTLPESYKISEREKYLYKTKTYRLDSDRLRVRGYTDELQACIQAIYKILSTEKGVYVIYSDNYGIQLNDLFGKNIHIAAAVLEERITEALTYDERIIAASDFSFSSNRRGELSVKFTAHTIHGDTEIIKSYVLKGGMGNV